MKKLVFLLFFAGVLAFSGSSSAAELLQRRVFLWDVTLSMTGKAGCPNIWQPVKDKLMEEINLITDPSVEIVIIPFQHRALHEHMQTDFANTEGKTRLVNFIREYELPRMWIGAAESGCEAIDGNGKTTMTALYAPLNHCLEKVITPDKLNVLVLMTDGKSDFPEDAQKFRDLIRNFCSETEGKNVFTFYVMLTSQAIDEEVSSTCERITSIPPGASIEFNPQEISPQQKIVLNTHDDFGKKIILRFRSGTSAVLKPGYKVRVVSNDNPYLSIDAVCEISSDDLSIEVVPQFKETPDVMRSMLNSGNDAEISLNFIPEASMKNSHPLVFMQPGANTKVDLIGAPERTIKMHWE